MKKFIAGAMVVAVLAGLFAWTAAANDEIKVTVNGAEFAFDISGAERMEWTVEVDWSVPKWKVWSVLLGEEEQMPTHTPEPTPEPSALPEPTPEPSATPDAALPDGYSARVAFVESVTAANNEKGEQTQKVYFYLDGKRFDALLGDKYSGVALRSGMGVIFSFWKGKIDDAYPMFAVDAGNEPTAYPLASFDKKNEVVIGAVESVKGGSLLLAVGGGTEAVPVKTVKDVYVFDPSRSSNAAKYGVGDIADAEKDDWAVVWVNDGAADVVVVVKK